MRRVSVGIVLLLVVSALVLAGCGGGGGAGQPSSSLQVRATDYQFEPASATVKAGQDVTFELVNNGSVEHEWVLMSQAATVPFDEDDEGNVLWEIEAEEGETVTGDFTAPATPGEYKVVCGVPGHLEAGMVGTLTVVE